MQYTLHKIHDFLMGHFSQFIAQIFMQKSILLRSKKFEKIRRGPKLEGDAFANFGYSSGTEGE